MSDRRALLSFPDPVDEVSARLVAGGVAFLAVVAVVARQPWLALPLAYGFVARVAAGPRFSPWALLVTRLLRPRLRWAERPVPGPPKRFAQGIGACLTVVAAAVHVMLGWTTVSLVLLAGVAVAATLESGFGLCIGCKLFAVLVRRGLLPASVCEACADLRLRGHPAAS